MLHDLHMYVYAHQVRGVRSIFWNDHVLLGFQVGGLAAVAEGYT